MKVLAINGSPKKEGNTYHGLRIALKELEDQGMETEVLWIGNEKIRGCTACNGCRKNRDEKCVLEGDRVNEYIQKMKEADGILLGSPVYFSSVAGTMKSFLDRAFFVASGNDGLFRHKVGAGMVAVRRAGGVQAYQQLNTYLNFSEMFVPSSHYWNVIFGAAPGEALQDEEGVQIMEMLGKNMAWLLKSNEQSKDLAKPEKGQKKKTNMIR
ncbi:MAG TPA: flavodoxin family protein [Eubacteriaceae bacterium]|nr:flavodoxin family protein [Eubacteriaceae bacterium]